MKGNMFNKKEYNKKYREMHREELNKDAIIRAREWRINHPEQLKEYHKKHYQNNKLEILKYHDEYRLTHKNSIKEYAKEYRKNNISKTKENNKNWNKNNPNYNQEYYQEHKEEKLEYSKLYSERNKVKRNINLKIKRQIDVNFKIINNLRVRLYLALKGLNKSKTTVKLLGVSIDTLKLKLETKFKLGMSWSNYGTGWNGKGMQEWHIDHIKPCASFDLSKPSEQRKCFHYTNLQPLWAKENLEKNDKIL